MDLPSHFFKDKQLDTGHPYTKKIINIPLPPIIADHHLKIALFMDLSTSMATFSFTQIQTS